MHPGYKKKSVIGLVSGLGLLLAGGGWFLWEMEPIGLGIFFLVAGLPLYLWGCCALALAKGYSTAIVLTAVFGLVFPMFVLFALPDREKMYAR